MQANKAHKTNSLPPGSLHFSLNRLLKVPCSSICNNYRTVEWRILWDFSCHFSNVYPVPWRKV